MFTLNLELVSDCILAVHVLDGASVLACVITTHFTHQ